MRILLYVNQDGGQAESDEWLRQLKTNLPEADIQIWVDASSPVECDYAVVWKAPSELLLPLSEQCGIKAIFNLGAGVDALLVQGGSNIVARVPIVRIDDAGMAEQMSDYVAASILRYYRNFHVYAAQQQSSLWKPQLPVEKTAFPIGLLGYGTLSRCLRAQPLLSTCALVIDVHFLHFRHVASTLRSLGFTVSCWKRTHTGEPLVFTGADGLKDMLQHVRVLVCMLPLTPATTGIINKESMLLLPRGSFIINVGRGPHVVEDDLLQLLQSGHISAACLDVTSTEPLPQNHQLWHIPNVTITPHIAAATIVPLASLQVAEKIRALSQGQGISGVVDAAHGY
jgi:glyoxylate/hydroxypyruvate reductase A